MSAPSASRTLVMTATYNEIENLPPLVAAVCKLQPTVDFLVVDDNSPDGTGRWCAERAKSDSRFHCIHRAGKLGLGTAILAGMQFAIEHDYTYVVNMDADFSHHPQYLAAMIGGMERDNKAICDVMIGSRYVPGGGTKDWPWRRKLMSRCINHYARWLLWLRPQDCSGGYRCYRVDSLKKVEFTKFRSRGYSFQQEVLWLLKQTGARISETPIIFADREKGLSKINLRVAFTALGTILRLGIKNWLKI